MVEAARKMAKLMMQMAKYTKCVCELCRYVGSGEGEEGREEGGLEEQSWTRGIIVMLYFLCD